MKTKKILTSLLLTLFVVFTSVSVFAADAVAEISGVTYASLQDAFNEATSGDTIILLDEVTVDSMLKVEGNKSVTLDLNGHTITAGSLSETNNMVLYITNGDTVIINDSVGGGGIVNNSYYGYAILNQGTLVVNNGTFIGDTALWNGYDTINSTATINGGTFSFNDDAAEGYSVGNSGTMIINDGATINDWVDTFGSLTVNGGGIANIYASSSRTTVAEINITITNGTIGELYVDEDTTDVVSVTGGTFTSDVSEYVPEDYSAVTNADGTVSVTSNYEAEVNGTKCTLTNALATGGNVTLLKDVSSSSIIKIEKDTVLDLNGFTVTGSAKKTFEVYANATFKNGTIKNVYTNKEGRCIDTRTGGITLALDDISLLANTNGWNQQVINIGGDATGKGAITVDIANSTITASNSGYGITTFNPVDMTITNTEISGYAALYFKGASSSMGSKGSVVDVVKSTLNSAYISTESFGTIVFEDIDISVNVDNESSITTEGTAICFSDFTGSLATENINVSLNGTVSAGKIVDGWRADATVSSTNANVITALENEGFVVTEGTIADKLAWTSATDAGYYMVGDAKTGLMRYLFHADITKDITEAGILYVNASIFDKDAPDTNKMGEIKGAPSSDNAFYGDITGIPENTTGTYYAVAYVKTADGTFWSGVVGCEPSFDKHFSSLDGGVK